jgi:hypothetical protein
MPSYLQAWLGDRHPEAAVRSAALEGRRPAAVMHPSRLAALAPQDDGYRRNGIERGRNPTANPLDTAGHSAVWPSAMKLNRTIRRACQRRRTSDDGLRRVRRLR